MTTKNSAQDHSRQFPHLSQFHSASSAGSNDVGDFGLIDPLVEHRLFLLAGQVVQVT
jgi:hypothetical protein